MSDLKIIHPTASIETNPLEHLKSNDFPKIIGNSPALLLALDRARKIAAIDMPNKSILISGENGSGKELFAKTIQYFGKRRDDAFSEVNCGCLTGDTSASVIFGHKKGSFTGASQDNPGLLLSTAGGTVFLDEIGDLPLEAQIKLLRVLDGGGFQQIGSNKVIYPDVQIIAATNRNLGDHVAKGFFREDLYHRLSMFKVEVPPLRHRREDIPCLAKHFLGLFRGKNTTRCTSFEKAALDHLSIQYWPGNVRELRNVIYTAAAMTDSEKIGMDSLLIENAKIENTRVFSDMHYDLLRYTILFFLQEYGWNISKISGLIGRNRTDLYKFIDRLGIKKGDEHSAPKEKMECVKKILDLN